MFRMRSAKVLVLLISFVFLAADWVDKDVASVLTRRKYWAFQKPVRPAAPSGIDALILEGLKAKGLEPSPPLDRRRLLRRLSFDLTGLPPTPEEVESFVNDPSPMAYQKVVDRLLASPHYGERWALRWLDLVRYADTNGYE